MKPGSAMTPSIYFRAPWGTPLKVITLGVVLLAGAAMVAGVTLDLSAPARLLALGIPPAGVVAASLFRVLGFHVTDDAVVVVRPGWRTRIPLAGLQRVEPAAEALRGSLRLWGNGGFFSFTGWYWSRALGRFRLFANDGRRAVVLWFPDRRVVVAPEDPAGLVEALRQRVPRHG